MTRACDLGPGDVWGNPPDDVDRCECGREFDFDCEPCRHDNCPECRADCSTCGRTIQNRHGRCAMCGSSSIWTLGVAVPEPTDVQVSATLARVAFLADVKSRAVERNERSRTMSSRRIH